VIARTWSARATPADAPAYAEHLRTRVLPALRAVEGYLGGQLLRREEGGTVELLVVTWWRSLDALRAFAGSDLERAVVADEAVPLLTRFDRRVRHYEVVVEDGAPSSMQNAKGKMQND
jgi:heme-degrading monooxygenase HmoA